MTVLSSYGFLYIKTIILHHQSLWICLRLQHFFLATYITNLALHALYIFTNSTIQMFFIMVSSLLMQWPAPKFLEYFDDGMLFIAVFYFLPYLMVMAFMKALLLNISVSYFYYISFNKSQRFGGRLDNLITSAGYHFCDYTISLPSVGSLRNPGTLQDKLVIRAHVFPMPSSFSI